MKNFENLIQLDSVKTMPVMSLPVRSVAVQLSEGAVLISPGSNLTPEQLQRLAPVSDVVANNGFHNAGMPQARRIFPQARAWGPEGRGYPNILRHEAWPHQDQLPMIKLEGAPRLNEVVFIDKKSRTLICADLCFNLLHACGAGSWIILHMFGTYRRFAVSKFIVKFIKDKGAFEDSLGQLFSYDFDNILMAHGDPLIGGGRDQLLKAFAERDLKPRLKRS